MINAQLNDDEFEVFQKRFKQNLKERPERIAASLSDAAELPLIRAKTHYLTGAALKVQSNRLRSSVTKKPSKGAIHSGKEFKVSVGTRVGYGRAWEEGFSGTFSIKAHIRKIKSRNIKSKRQTISKLQRLYIGGKKTASGIAFVKAHMRKMDQKARPWLQPSFQDEKPGIINILLKAGVIFK